MKILSRHMATFSPEAVQNIFPFAFATEIPTVLTVHDFMLKWREHIDTKTTKPLTSTIDDTFTRDFHTFQSDGAACVFFGGVCAVDDDIADPTSTDVVDDDIVELFPHML